MFTTPDTGQQLDIPRDRWGRPLITPPDGGKPVPYTRVSTLAKALDDKTALGDWKCRQVALGLAARADLVTKVQAVGDSKAVLKEVVEEAMTAAQSGKAANIGTSLHSFTERVDRGEEPASIVGVDSPLLGDLVAYRNAMHAHRVTVAASELFVVCDELQAAGTFDRLVDIPGIGLVVADIKTGQHEPDYPHGVAQQIAIYAHGTLYDVDQGRVAPLSDLGVRTDVGLLIHLPSERGVCDLYLIDLDHGWALAQTAVAVRGAYKSKPLTPYTPATAPAAVTA